MIGHIPSLERLIHELSKLPGIGPKTAQRLGYFLMRSSEANIQALRSSLHDVKTLVKECPRCFSFTEEDLCQICRDPQRSDESLCVVEDPADVGRIEFSGVFRGRYHVLQGAISPLDGVGPEDLKIQALLDRLEASRKGEGSQIKEVILALDADLEGDTTVLYLSKILKELGVPVSRIAHGVPIGGDIDYIDHRTLGRAIENRVQV